MIRFLILFFYYYVPVALYLIVIFVFSSLSINVNSIPLLRSDKVAHIVEYSLLGFLFMRAYLNTAGLKYRLRGIFTTTIFTFLFGCSDEYHQLFVPNRVVSLGDVMADTAGGFIGSIFYLIVLYIIFKKEKVDGKPDRV